MREQHVVRHAVHLAGGVHGPAGRVLAAAVVAQHGGAPRLVQGDPVLHAVAEAVEAKVGVGGEVVDDLGVEPAVLLQLVCLVGVGMGGGWVGPSDSALELQCKAQSCDRRPNPSRQHSPTPA